MDVWAFSAYALIVCRLVLTSVGQMNETDYWSKVRVTIYLQIRFVLALQVQVAVHLRQAVASLSSRSPGFITRSVSEVWCTKWHCDRFFSEYFDFLYQYHFTNTRIFWARFAKLRKATINFVMSVRVRVESNTWLPLDGFSWNLIFQYSKICRENSSFVTIGQEWQIFYMKTDICTFMIISRSVLLRMRTVSNKRWRENQNTNLSSKTCFRKSRRLWGNVEKYFRSGQATDDNMAHAHSMLDN